MDLRRISRQRQIEVPVYYKGRQLEKRFRLDLLVSQLVIVVVKAVAEFNAVYLAQCLAQSRVTGKKLGLVINFGEKYVKDGIHRIVNEL